MAWTNIRGKEWAAREIGMTVERLAWRSAVGADGASIIHGAMRPGCSTKLELIA
jgi:hypothetical protein